MGEDIKGVLSKDFDDDDDDEGIFPIDHYTAAPDPCIDLWSAIIRQALLDALWCDRTPDKPLTNTSLDEQRRRRMAAGVRARRWLLEDEIDFPFNCDLIGLDPRVVRRAARAAISRRQAKQVEI